jgi:hypothetical protein
MFIFGGYDNGGFASNTLYRFDIPNSCWIESMPCPTIPARFNHTMVLNPKTLEVLVFGGCSADRTVFNDLHTIKIEENGKFLSLKIKHEGTIVPANRFGHASYIYESNLHIYGGCNFQQDFNNGYIFDTESKTWSQTEFQHTNCTCFATVTCNNKGDILVIGGTSRNNQDISTDASFGSLCDETIHATLLFCDLPTLTTLCCVSKSWNVSRVAGSNIFWKSIYDQRVTSLCSKKYQETLLEMLSHNDLFENGYKNALTFIYNNIHEDTKRPQLCPRVKAYVDAAHDLIELPPPKIVNMPVWWKVQSQIVEGNPCLKAVVAGDGASGN